MQVQEWRHEERGRGGGIEERGRGGRVEERGRGGRVEERGELPRSKRWRSLKTLSRNPPPKTSSLLLNTAMAVWPARGVGAVPYTVGVLHVMTSIRIVFVAHKHSTNTDINHTSANATHARGGTPTINNPVLSLSFALLPPT